MIFFLAGRIEKDYPFLTKFLVALLYNLFKIVTSNSRHQTRLHAIEQTIFLRATATHVYLALFSVDDADN